MEVTFAKSATSLVGHNTHPGRRACTEQVPLIADGIAAERKSAAQYQQETSASVAGPVAALTLDRSQA